MDKHLDAQALGDYAEGLLDAGARAAADAHLAACAQCRGELAAVQAYFRELADLEPVRAPADFLAKVRARLPRPSPWERAWAALLVPFRFVPAPIAVAVILGVTAITVYMRQGGPEIPAAVPASEALSAPGSLEPAGSSVPPESSESVGSTEPIPAMESPVAAPAPRPSVVLSRPGSHAGGASAKSQTRIAGRRERKDDLQPESPREMPVARMEPPASAPEPPPATDAKPKASTQAGSAPEAIAKDASPPSPATAAPSKKPTADAAKKLRDVEVSGWLDNPSAVYILDNSTASANLPLDKTMSVEEESAVPGQAEAAAGNAAQRKEEDKRKAKDGSAKAAPANEEKSAAASASGYALSLRAKSDTASVLAGLRSMGVEAEPEYASSVESRFRLKVPAAMLRELGPYLARHGESRVEGALPTAAPGSVLPIRLRLLYPAR